MRLCNSRFRRPGNLTLASLYLLFSLSIEATAHDCGDLTADGSITSNDALSALAVATGIIPACDLSSCDTDCNGESTATDALIILQAAVGLGDLACCAIDECFEDADCVLSGFPEGYVCAGFSCVQCDDDTHCDEGFECTDQECVPNVSSSLIPGREFTLDARPGFLHTAAVAEPDGYGGFVVVWSDGDAGQPLQGRIAAQIYDPTIEGFRAALDLSGTSQNLLRPVAACASAAGTYNVAWEDQLPTASLPTGIYLDVANVRLRNAIVSDSEPSAPPVANDNLVGSQSDPAIACRTDGTFVVAWRNVCLAVERRGTTSIHYRPEECETEPANGIYWRRFSADGMPLGPSIRVDAPDESIPGNPSLAALPDGGALLLAPYRLGPFTETTVIRIDGAGTTQTLLTIDTVPLSFSRHSLHCFTSRCIAVLGEFGNDVVVDVIETDPPARSDRFIVAQNDPGPPDGTAPIYVDDARASCDPIGRCLITWVRKAVEIDYDVILSETTTPLARVFDATAGLLGPVVALSEPALDHEPPVPFSVAAEVGSFAVLFHGAPELGIPGRFYGLRD
jgi:hypothetical protein